MSSGIRLNGWPSVPNCLSWSEDGLLAVALGEQVDILVPKLQLSEPWRNKTEDERWHKLHLPVNLFTEEESPFVRPLSFRNFSVGEEQSFSHVVSLAWSSEGLAKHQRCALAVLTSNLVLSIWAADTDPRYEKNWKRVLVVNHTLKKGFNAFASLDQARVTQDFESTRLKCRIRSFYWAPSLPDSQSSDHDFARDAVRPFSHHFLAATNDAGQIILMAIESPYRLMRNASKSWSAKLLACHDASVAPFNLGQPETLYSSPICAENQISDISWSPYIGLKQGDRETLISVLAYVISSRLNLLLCGVSAHEGRLKVSLLREKKDFGVDYKGPLDWTPTVSKV